MPVKKAPTRKQLAARRKFVAMVKVRSRVAAAAKRKAGYKLRAGKWVAPKTKRAATSKKRNPLHFKSAADYSKWQTQAKKSSSSVSSAPRAASKKSRVTIRKKTQKVGALGRLFSGSGRLGLGRSRTTYKVKRNSASVMKNGRRLYGAAAQAVLRSKAKRNSTTRRRGVLLSGRKRNGIFRSAIRSAVSKRLSAPISFRRKSRSKHGRYVKEGYGLIRNGRRNSGAPAGIEEMHEKFLGRPSSHTFEIVAPQGTPADVAVLGELVALKTEDEEFVFDKGEAFMGADAKGNLYVLGDVQVESSTNFGEIEEIDYLARKDHLEANPFNWRRRRTARRNPGQLIEYYHIFNEDNDGTPPKLKSDSDGMIHITGGSYTLEPEGITG